MRRLMCEISFLIVILLRLHVLRNLRYDVRMSHLFTEEGRNNNYCTWQVLFCLFKYLKLEKFQLKTNVQSYESEREK